MHNMHINFEWDENKNMLNQAKHEVSFEDAKTVLWDENAVLIPDPAHSADEERFILLGFDKSAKMLIVVHCYRLNGSIIRLISARKATKNEKKQYSAKMKEGESNERRV